jgi:hypothetical protein
VSNRPTRLGPTRLGPTRLGLIGGLALTALLACHPPSAFAQAADARGESDGFDIQKAFKRIADATALGDVTSEAKPAPPSTAKRTSAKGPYYVDFRARTAASWGHAFVWYGKTSERQVEVAGLTPKGDEVEYVIGYMTLVPSETGASYGDLDPQYLTANYRVYLNEADAKRVFAYIKKLQASSPVWNAETFNCTSFIGDIASYMGLKTPSRWLRPENYVNRLKEMNGGRQIARLSAEQ